MSAVRVRPVVTPGTAGTSSGPFGPDGETFDAATDVRLVGDEEVPALDAAPRLPVRTGVPIPLLHPGATGRSSSDRPAP